MKKNYLNVETEKLITEEEAAEILSLTKCALQNLRYKNKQSCPPYIKIGGAVRYSPTALRQFIEGNTYDPSLDHVLDQERKYSKKSA